MILPRKLGALAGAVAFACAIGACGQSQSSHPAVSVGQAQGGKTNPGENAAPLPRDQSNASGGAGSAASHPEENKGASTKGVEIEEAHRTSPPQKPHNKPDSKDDLESGQR